MHTAHVDYANTTDECKRPMFTLEWAENVFWGVAGYLREFGHSYEHARCNPRECWRCASYPLHGESALARMQRTRGGRIVDARVSKLVYVTSLSGSVYYV